MAVSICAMPIDDEPVAGRGIEQDQAADRQRQQHQQQDRQLGQQPLAPMLAARRGDDQLARRLRAR